LVPGAFSFAGSMGCVGNGAAVASSGRISTITHHNGLASLGAIQPNNKIIYFT
jgi:hypothetical protein